MLDQLVNLVKEYSGDAVINNPEVPNEKNEEVMAEATNTIAGGFQNLISGGGLQSIISMFKGGGNANGGSSGAGNGLMSNPIVSMMIGHFAKKLMSKFNVNSGAAGNVASNLIPNVLNGLISKTNDPNNSAFSLESLIGSLTGGASSNTQNSGAATAAGGSAATGFDLNGIISKFTGDRDGDGDTDLQDALAAITGGARQQQAQQAQQSQSGGGSGLMDMIKGFMG